MKKSTKKSTDVIPQEVLAKCVKIVVTQHAFDEWQERVGPFAESKEEVEYHLQGFLVRQGRIHRLRRNCVAFECLDRDGYLQDKIFAGCTIFSGNVLVVKTFFGRSSIEPKLNNLNELGSFMRAQRPLFVGSQALYSHRNEGIDLVATKTALAKTTWPHFSRGIWKTVHESMGEGSKYAQYAEQSPVLSMV